jgi:hypothetical protein
MDLEGRKNNTYFDQTGKQILVGDLLKVYHFRTRHKIYYMYHIVVMEESTFPVMAMRDIHATEPHYRMYVVADNDQRVYHSATIFDGIDNQAKRLKIKVNNPVNPN